MCCSQCHIAWYCDRSCQKLHWKQHKRACVAAVAAEAQQATRVREATVAARGGGGVGGAAGAGVDETCVICIGPVIEPVEVRRRWAGVHWRWCFDVRCVCFV